MSGFEVAGVVLGALPLIIEGLKAVKEVKRAVDVVTKRDVLLSRYVSALECHQYDIEDVVLKIARHARIEQILENTPQPGQWSAMLKAHSLKIEHVLQGAQAKTFLDTLLHVNDLYKEFVQLFEGLFPIELSFGRTEMPFLEKLIVFRWQASRRLDDARRRVHFLRRKTEIAQNLEELEKAIKRLSGLAARLTGPSAPIGLAVSQSESSFRVTQFEKVQQAATKLFSALKSAVPGECTTHNHHTLRLFLEAHARKMEVHEISATSFVVEFLAQESGPAAEVQHRERIIVPVGAVDVVKEDNDTASQVRFAVPQLVLEQCQIANEPTDKMDKIDDLCATLRNVQDGFVSINVSALGLLQCQKTKSATKTSNKNLTSLTEVLRENTKKSKGCGAWTISQRVSLGFVLASSLLQLNRAHWIPQHLNADVIHFYHQQRTLDDFAFDDTQPFLECHCPLQEPNIARPNHAKHWALDLAILLLELWVGTSFVDSTSALSSEYNIRLEAALSWFEDVESDILPLYQAAISDCLGIAATSIHKWDTRGFREHFWERVVRPLEEFCRF